MALVFSVLAGSIIAAQPSAAEDDLTANQLLDSIRIQPLGHIEPLRFGMLLSGQGDVGPSEANDQQPGFRITDARLLMAGRLEKGFGYLIQAEFIQSSPILDLILDWESDETGTRISGGLFRTPFCRPSLHWKRRVARAGRALPAS